MAIENTHCITGAASTARIPVAVLVGPTAAGKSAVALRLAEELGWEIVSCDSRQIYRGMDTGTAKPTLEQRRVVRHWLIDVLDPSEEYSAFRFAREAAGIIRNRAREGKRVLVCGGTGFYFRALSGGVDNGEKSDPRVRECLMKEASLKGTPALFSELKKVDPESAVKIHENDLHRIVRALAVFRQTGEPVSLYRKRTCPPHDMEFTVAKLSVPRKTLYETIDRRVAAMVGSGLWEEFMRLRTKGFTRMSPGLQSLGYRELFAVERGACTLEEAVEQIRKNTRRYAKRQITWFSHQVEGREFAAPVEYDLLKRFFLDGDR